MLLCRLLTATEIFYDSDHPDVFVYIQNPAASLTGPAPNSSKVLLLNSQPAVNGYTNAGSLYRGSGYWAQGPSLPQPLSDLNVRLLFLPPLKIECQYRKSWACIWYQVQNRSIESPNCTLNSVSSLSDGCCKSDLGPNFRDLCSLCICSVWHNSPLNNFKLWHIAQ